MGNANHQRYLRRPVLKWRVLKDNQRQLPCHPSVRVRVKVLEPGVQSRRCDRCDAWRYFILEPMTGKMEGTLRLRWLSEEEVAVYEGEIDEAMLDEVDWLCGD